MKLSLLKLSLLLNRDLLAWLRVGFVAALLGFSVSASAQGILSQAQTGTIQVLAQDDGFLTISGRNYGYDNEIVEVTLGGEPLDAAFLDAGMVVRYTVDRAGNLQRLEVLGPITKTEILQEN